VLFRSTQPITELGVRPSSLATLWAVLPGCWHRRTTSALYSSVNIRRLRFFLDISCELILPQVSCPRNRGGSDLGLNVATLANWRAQAEEDEGELTSVDLVADELEARGTLIVEYGPVRVSRLALAFSSRVRRTRCERVPCVSGCDLGVGLESHLGVGCGELMFVRWDYRQSNEPRHSCLVTVPGTRVSWQLQLEIRPPNTPVQGEILVPTPASPQESK
jgi:hypothetical protein